MSFVYYIYLHVDSKPLLLCRVINKKSVHVTLLVSKLVLAKKKKTTVFLIVGCGHVHKYLKL